MALRCALNILGVSIALAACPCSDVLLCEPLLSRSNASREVFVFHITSGSDWRLYDWSTITTIALFGQFDPELYCFAHAAQVSVVHTVFLLNHSSISDPAVRRAWVAQHTLLLTTYKTDGLNLDIEHFVGRSVDLTALTQETVAAVRAINSYAQVTFDVNIRPIWHTDHYDFPAIARACDFLVP